VFATQLHPHFTLPQILFPPMIETEFYILSAEQYNECYRFAEELGVTVDYFLLEFTDIETQEVEVN
jgi:hypothetical protein